MRHIKTSTKRPENHKHNQLANTKTTADQHNDPKTHSHTDLSLRKLPGAQGLRLPGVGLDPILVLLAVLLLKLVRTPVAILGSLGVCIYVPASRHVLISYSPIHLA